MPNRDILINKFNNNQLLFPVLGNILRQFDDKTIDKITGIFEDIAFDDLNDADNKIVEAIIQIKNTPELAKLIDADNLKDQLIRLQLNVLLAHCKEKETKIVSPLVNALEKKIEALNKVIESRRDIKTPSKGNISVRRPVGVLRRPQIKLDEALTQATETKQEEPEQLDKIGKVKKNTPKTVLDAYEKMLEKIPERRKFETFSSISKKIKKTAEDYLYMAYQYLRKFRYDVSNADRMVALLNYNSAISNYKRQKKIEKERKDTGQKGGDIYYQKYLKYKSKYFDISMD